MWSSSLSVGYHSLLPFASFPTPVSTCSKKRRRGCCSLCFSLSACTFGSRDVVRDANGQALAIYSRDNEDEARQAKVLKKDEARRIAINMARLPELLGKAEPD
jgi:hypothetical protein